MKARPRLRHCEIDFSIEGLWNSERIPIYARNISCIYGSSLVAIMDEYVHYILRNSLVRMRMGVTGKHFMCDL
jgi:hypothetical protein